MTTEQTETAVDSNTTNLVSILPPVGESLKILEIRAKKTKISETYAINDSGDLASAKSRMDDKYLNPEIVVKKASLTFKVSMEANPTEKSPAKIVSFAETYKIESGDDLTAFIEVAKEKLDEDGLLLKNASIAFKMDIDVS